MARVASQSDYHREGDSRGVPPPFSLGWGMDDGEGGEGELLGVDGWPGWLAWCGVHARATHTVALDEKCSQRATAAGKFTRITRAKLNGEG